jgi:hypothetical protein
MQFPQYLTSDEVSTHWPSHSERPALHEKEQALLTHALVASGGGVQLTSHLPQWVTSLVRSKQASPQRWKSPAHTKSHFRSLQVGLALAGASHFLPQAPQFEVSLERLTQELSQSVVSSEQRRVQMPAEQVWSDRQAFGQLPQCAASEARSTQRPSQGV